MEDIYSLPAGLLYMQVAGGPTVYYLFSCVAFFVTYVYSSKTKSQASAHKQTQREERERHPHTHHLQDFGNRALQLTSSVAIHWWYGWL